MSKPQTCVWLIGMALLVLIGPSVSTYAQDNDEPKVTANSDGSCILHRPNGDVPIANGATYYIPAVQRSHGVYREARTYLCKDGHIHRVKPE